MKDMAVRNGIYEGVNLFCKCLILRIHESFCVNVIIIYALHRCSLDMVGNCSSSLLGAIDIRLS